MISFAAPWVLAGLVAAAIPLLLHLFARREPPTVDFPAVRYLAETARTHQRRLQIQHWFLLALRTLLVVLLVLAAAGPSLRPGGSTGHAPAALVLIVDNSPSSGVTAGGIPLLEGLRSAARRVLERATGADELWLLTASGVVRRGRPSALREVIDSLMVSPRRLDLGPAVSLAREVLSGTTRPGEVILLTDLQATALSAAPGGTPVVVARPAAPAVPNLGIAAVLAGPQPWTADGGTVTIRLAGSDSTAVPVSVTLGDRPARQALGRLGQPVSVPVPATGSGWVTLSVDLAPDELRLDDRWTTAVRVASPARVSWSGGDRHVRAAAEVLRDGGRIQAGTEVSLGELGGGPSVVMPPEDPARVGAFNRALAARGVPWRLGALSGVPVAVDSNVLLGREQVFRRYLLEPTGSDGSGVLARAGGEPWMVRHGTVVLLASRFDPAWTSLPLSARFVPLLDALLNRVVRGDAPVVEAAPGDPVVLPDDVDAILLPSGRLGVEGGSTWRPATIGVHYLLRGSDTVGAVAVNVDPRESDLRRAADAAVEILGGDVRVVDLAEAPAAAFRAGGHADLRGPLLWLVLLIGLVEAGLAAWRRSGA